MIYCTPLFNPKTNFQVQIENNLDKKGLEENLNSKSCQTGCCPTPAATGSNSCPGGNMKLALDPVQSDFLALNIKTHEEKPYNIHELPSVDGEFQFSKPFKHG